MLIPAGIRTAAYEYTYDANGYLHKFTEPACQDQVTVYKYTQSDGWREYYVNDLDRPKRVRRVFITITTRKEG